MKIVCIGDSLVYGYGIDRNNVWTAKAENILGCDVINKGICGDTTSGMLSRFFRDVIDEKPDYVFIMGGINDFIMEADISAVKSNIMAMVHQAIFYGIKPIIGIPLKFDACNIKNQWSSFTDFQRVLYQLEAYRQWIFKFSKTFDVKYIDFYKNYSEKMDGINDKFIDGLHPNLQGNISMAEIFCSSFKSIL